MQTQKADFGHSEGRREWDELKRVTLTYILPSKTANGNLWCGHRKLSSVPGANLEGWDGGGGQEEGDMYVLVMIHAVVWQKPTQYCKAIILQLKILKSFYKKKIFVRVDIRHY